MSHFTVNYHYLDVDKRFAYHDLRRSNFQEIYGALLSQEHGLSGSVIDIGCGHTINPTYARISPLVGQLDGCDPFPADGPSDHLRKRWVCPLEELPVPPNSYDLAYSYNVVEHVSNPATFLAKAVEVIKPGGVYWSMSPNARHPFTWITRISQALHLKSLYRNTINQKANDYPAYYRLSHDHRILCMLERLELPVASIDFYFVPCVQWDMFYPKWMRSVPHLLDAALLLRNPKYAFVFMFRLQKLG